MTEQSSESRQNLIKLSQAISSFYAGDFESAEPVFREGAAFFQEGSEELSECLQRLSTIYTEWGRPSDAARLNVRLLAIMRKVQGANSPELEPIMLQLADLYERMGRMDESMQMLQRIELLKQGALMPSGQDELDSFESELYAASSEFVDRGSSSGYFTRLSQERGSAGSQSQSGVRFASTTEQPPQDAGFPIYQFKDEVAEKSLQAGGSSSQGGSFSRSRGVSSARHPVTANAEVLRQRTSRAMGAADNPASVLVSRIAEPTKAIIARTFDVSSRIGHNFRKAFLPMAILGVVLFMTAWFFMPRAIKGINVFNNIPHEYRSVDGKILFTLRDLSNCMYTIEGSPATASYAFFLNDWRDALSVAFGPIIQKSYLMRTVNEALEGEDGTRFYPEGSSGKRVLDQMSRIADAVNAQYDKKRKVYSSSVTAAASNLTYKNPYTKKAVAPSVQTLNLGSDDDQLKAEVARSLFDRDLTRGAKWSKEPAFSAGAIHCALINMKSPKGNSSMFVIRGFDGTAAPIRSTATDAHYLLLENGKLPTCLSHRTPFSQPSVRRQVIWFFPMAIDSGLLAFLMHGPVAIFMGSSVILLLIIFAGPPEFRGRMALPLAASVVAAAMLSFSDKLP